MSYQLLLRDSSFPILPPFTTKASPGRRGNFLAFFGTAAAAGILFHTILFGLGALPSNGHATASTIKDWGRGEGANPADSPSRVPDSTDDNHIGLTGNNCSFNARSSYIRPGLGQYVVQHENEWTTDRIRKMVEGTKGYYARDYSLHLGWNNVSFRALNICCPLPHTSLSQMRYIIEAAILHAHLLNRTLVLPSFVYGRACEWNM
jgi:hypothetical protein